jgi:predicted peptidase
MPLLAVLALSLQLTDPAPARIHTREFTDSSLGTFDYALTLPAGYDANHPPPLILALHPGSKGMPSYGRWFTLQLVQPALSALGAVVVAPDCPSTAWADPRVDTAVMALLASVMQQYPIDKRRVLVAGFSMGGRGAWFFASRHPEVFTGAIVAAGSTGEEWTAALGTQPTYSIHSRADRVAPFAAAERVARALQSAGRDVHFDALDDISHYELSAYTEALRRAAGWIAARWAR